MEINKVLKKILCTSLTCLMTVSSVLNTMPYNKVNAETKSVAVSAGTRYYYTKYGLGTKSTTYTKKYNVSLNGNTVNAFCLEPDKKAPGSGTYSISSLSVSSKAAKAMYYGWNAPASEQYWKNHYNSLETGARYIIVHIAAARALGNNWSYCTSSKAKSIVNAFYSWLDSQPDIPDNNDVFFQAAGKHVSKVNELTVTPESYYGNCSNIGNYSWLKTMENKFTGAVSIRNYNEAQNFELSLPDNIRAVIMTNDSQRTIQRVTDYGETIKCDGSLSGKYIYSFIMKNGDTKMKGSIELKGSSLSKSYHAYKLSNGKAKQDLGCIVSLSEPSESTLTVNWSSTADLYITKSDEYGKAIKGTVFSIGKSTNDDKVTDIVKTVETDQDGELKVELEKGTYYVQESSVPKPFKRDKTIKKVTLEAGDEKSLAFVNEHQTGTVTVEKIDEDSKKPLKGAVLKITNTSSIYFYNVDTDDFVEEEGLEDVVGKDDMIDDGLLEEMAKDEPTEVKVGEFTYSFYANDPETNKPAVIENLPLGDYVIEEVHAPDKYVLSDQKLKISLTYDQSKAEAGLNMNKSVSFGNEKIQGKIRVIKKSADSNKTVLKAGTEFQILASDKKTVVETIKTNQSGVAVSGLLDCGVYYIKESKAPDSYLIQAEVSKAVNIDEDGKTYTIEVKNKEARGSLYLSKEDSVNGKKPLGEGTTLEGAEYALTAKENITDPADNSIKFNKGDLVATLKTDKEGNAHVENLYLGEYDLKEVKPSNGYTLDPTHYSVPLEYDGDKKEIVTKKITSKERVESQAFQIIKINDDGDGESVKLKGAEFTIKLQSDVEKMGWDQAPVALNAQGKKVAVMVTDDNGYACSERLPKGVYIVRETKVPDNKLAVADFTVTVDKDSSEPQAWKILNDKSFKSLLRIVKRDKETGKVIQKAGTTFKIYNKDKKEYFGYWQWNLLDPYVDEWTTDESGTVTLTQGLKAGHYQLIEINAPDGYMTGETVDFEISSTMAYEIAEDKITPIIIKEVSDVSVKGRISVEKKGEVLTGYDENNHQFIYETKSLDNAEYEITAKEDILDASNDGTVIYKKGEVVETLKTVNGTAISKELPLGEYAVKEVKAPEGYTLSDEIKNVTLSYKDQVTPLIYEKTSFINDRQKVSVSAVKKDEETQELLAGAEITLTANKDIFNYKNELIIQKGTDIETVTTSKEGKVVFQSDLPIDISKDDVPMFILKETKAPDGYLQKDSTVLVDTHYQGQNTKMIEINSEFENAPTVTQITKTDITGEKELEGAHLSLKDKDGNIIEEWVSGKEPHIIKALLINEEYTLHEDLAPIGYATANDVQFTVKGDGTVTEVMMKDEITKVDISKVDATDGKEIEGAKLTLKDKESGKVVKTWVSENKPHRIEGLEVGKTYILHEDLAPTGYEVASDVEFTIKDTGKVQKVIMKDEHKSVVVKTGDHSKLGSYAGMMLIAGAAALVALKTRKKKESEDE
jgi:uncharacterized surface anchored protein